MSQINLSFDDNKIQVSYDTSLISNTSLFYTCTSVCDSTGTLVATYNGAYLGDQRRQEVSLADYGLPHQFFITLEQESKLFPWPGHPGRYALIDLDEDNLLDPVRYFRFARINAIYFERDADSSLHILRVDTAVQRGSYGEHLLTVRHANGRDWWIITFGHLYQEVYFFLLDPTGLHFMHEQPMYLPTRNEWNGTDSVPTSGLVFWYPPSISPDGTSMVCSRWINAPQIENYYYSYYMMIYDIDRCNGTLTFNREIPYQYPLCYGYSGAFTWSPDSKLLYWGCYDTLYQLDFHTDNPLSTRLAVSHWDTIPGERSNPPNKPANGWDWVHNRPTNGWSEGEITPDGRLLYCAGDYLFFKHLVEHPNVRGPGCEARFGALQLPDFAIALPAMPYYRLGPLDGSSCDTLGLDAAGLSPPEQRPAVTLDIVPNPNSGDCTVYLPPQAGTLTVTDMRGNRIRQVSINYQQGMERLQLPPGIFLVTYQSADGRVRVCGKVVVF